MKKNQLPFGKGQKTVKISKSNKSAKAPAHPKKKQSSISKTKAKPKKSKPSSIEQKPEQQSTQQNYYQIEKILKRRVLKNGEEEFLVSWKGYTSHSNRWISRSKIVGLHNLLIDQYLADLGYQVPEKAKPKSTKSAKNKKAGKKSKKGIKPGELIILQSDSISQNKQEEAKQPKNPQPEDESLLSEEESVEAKPAQVKPQKKTQPQITQENAKQVEVKPQTVAKAVESAPVSVTPTPVAGNSSSIQDKVTAKQYTPQQVQIFHRFYKSECPCCTCK